MEEPDDDLDGCEVDFVEDAISDEEAAKLLQPDPKAMTEEEHDGLRQKPRSKTS